MTGLPWDQRIARVLVRPLVATPVTPNHLTFVTLIMALAGAGFFAIGTPETANWGAGLFVLARFLDHFDGELARQKGLSSRFGYYFDYVTGGLSYGALFMCMGIGLRHGTLDQWALALGVAGLASAIISMFINLGIDKRHAVIGKETPRDSVGYPGFAGFELEDGIYLLAPITWFGYLTPFFAAAGIGAAVYTLWSLWTLTRLHRPTSSR